jgi:hypothetical protein
MSACPSQSPSTSAWRSMERAIAWRTRLSVNGSMSVRMWIWRCVDALTAMTFTFGSLRSALPPETEKCSTKSTSSPCRARIIGPSSS